MLGTIIGDEFMRTLTFHQIGKLVPADVSEIKMVCTKIARVMGYTVV